MQNHLGQLVDGGDFTDIPMHVVNSTATSSSNGRGMMATDPGGQIMVCTYRVCAGAQAQFEELLARHVLTLRPLELITDFPAQTMRRVDADEPEYIEVFEWVSDDAATGASEMSEGIEIWEPMAALCESRHGRSGLEFPLFDRVRPHR